MFASQRGADGSHVFPVAAEMVSVHISAITQQARNDVFAEIVFRFGSASSSIRYFFKTSQLKM